MGCLRSWLVWDAITGLRTSCSIFLIFHSDFGLSCLKSSNRYYETSHDCKFGKEIIETFMPKGNYAAFPGL